MCVLMPANCFIQSFLYGSILLFLRTTKFLTSSKAHLRVVEWPASTEIDWTAFETFIAPLCDDLSDRIDVGAAVFGDPLHFFGSDINELVRRLLVLVIRPGEDNTIGSKDSRATTGGSGMRESKWRTPAVEVSHSFLSKRQNDLVALVESGCSNPEAIAAATAVLDAASAAHSRESRDAQAAAALELILLVPPGGHEARRLHAMLRAIVRGGASTGPTHTFDEFQLDDDSPVITEHSEIAKALRLWM
jgi:hypothetical protein